MSQVIVYHNDRTIHISSNACLGRSLKFEVSEKVPGNYNEKLYTGRY